MLEVNQRCWSHVLALFNASLTPIAVAIIVTVIAVVTFTISVSVIVIVFEQVLQYDVVCALWYGEPACMVHRGRCS